MAKPFLKKAFGDRLTQMMNGESCHFSNIDEFYFGPNPDAERNKPMSDKISRRVCVKGCIFTGDTDTLAKELANVYKGSTTITFVRGKHEFQEDGTYISRIVLAAALPVATYKRFRANADKLSEDIRMGKRKKGDYLSVVCD